MATPSDPMPRGDDERPIPTGAGLMSPAFWVMMTFAVLSLMGALAMVTVLTHLGPAPAARAALSPQPAASGGLGAGAKER